jgi:Uma2 family endonuclease
MGVRIMEALADYQRFELIDGVVYDMSPASIKHILIQKNLIRIIDNFLRGKRCNVVFEAEVRFDEKNRFIPDISIVCNPAQIKSSYIDGAPDFVAEILSRSTKKRDITVKPKTYEKFGVKEYWVVDPKAESVDVYLLKDGQFELDETYHNVSDEELAELSEEDRAQERMTLKLSLYDELVIQVRDIFEM